MAKLSSRKANAIKHVLIYGPPKSGKTFLASKVAEKYKVIYFGIENGEAVMYQLPEAWQDNIELVAIPDTKASPMGIKTLMQVIKGNKGTVCEKHGAWNCATCKIRNDPVVEIHLNALSSDTIVIFDSLTQLTNSAIAFITEGQDEMYKMQFDDWGNLSKILDIFLSYVQNAPFHVICITHENMVEMVDGKEKIVPVAGSTKFSRNSAKYFDEVVYCEVKLGKHIAASSTTYAAAILTGSRTGHSIEKSGAAASLLPIFEGLVQPQSIASEEGKGTPASAALGNLAALKEKMKANQS